MAQRQVSLLCNSESEEITLVDNLSPQVCIYSTKASPEKFENEDSSMVYQIREDNRYLICVADGMGGHKGAGEASKIAITELNQKLSAFSPGEESLAELIMNTIEKIHEKIKSLGVGAGTTIAISEVAKDYVRFFNVGDSPCCLFGGRGTLKYKSIEHSPVGFGIEAGMISQEGAIKHEDKHLISNALGLEPYRLEVSGKISIKKRDVIMVASDGLSANLTFDQIGHLISKGPISRKLQNLVNASKKKMTDKNSHGHLDDLSIILFRWS